MRLVVEEVRDFLVEADEAVSAIKRGDIISGVGVGGGCHCLDCWDW